MQHQDKNKLIVNRNNEIIRVLMNEIEKKFSKEVELVGIYNTEPIEIQELKILVVINNLKASKLDKRFIVDGEGIAVSTCTWNELDSISKYTSPYTSELTELEILYTRNNNVVSRYKQLQNQLLNNKKNILNIKEYIGYYYKEIMYNYSIIDRTNDLSCAYMCLANIIKNTEIVLFMLNNLSIPSINIIQEKITTLKVLPENFINNYSDIANCNDIKTINSKASLLVKSIRELMNNLNISYYNDEIRNPRARRTKLKKEDLIGTYEKIWTEFKNKMNYASKTNNTYMSFMTMASCQEYYNKMISKYCNLPKLKLIELYTPYYLWANVNYFNSVFLEWKYLYDKYNIDTEYYIGLSNIDDIYKQKKL